MKKFFVTGAAAVLFAVSATGNAIAAGDFVIGAGSSVVTDTSAAPKTAEKFVGSIVVGSGSTVIGSADEKILRVTSVAPDQDLLVVGPVTADTLDAAKRDLMFKYLTNLVQEGRLDAADVSSAGEWAGTVSPRLRALERPVGVDKINRAEPDREMRSESAYRVDMNGTMVQVTSVAPDQDLLVVGPVTVDTLIAASRDLVSKYFANLIRQGKLDSFNNAEQLFKHLVVDMDMFNIAESVE